MKKRTGKEEEKGREENKGIQPCQSVFARMYLLPINNSYLVVINTLCRITSNNIIETNRQSSAK